MTRVLAAVGALAAAALAAALTLGQAAAERPAEPASEPGGASAVADGGASKFDHATHAAIKDPATDVGRCEACHASGKLGALIAPGASGHQPCLSSGCHVDDFLASGARMLKDEPARHARAARFCRGCHAGSAAPSRASKATADAVWKDNPSPDHHVELDHLEHTKKTECRSCHVVDAASLALIAAAPGHRECASCHGSSDGAPPMTACKSCHEAPGAATYFGKPRSSSDVRSCGSDGHRQLEADRKTAQPCFKHERIEHRSQGGQELQCKTCHFMVDDERRWGSYRYRTLKELRAAPVIHNKRDLAHQSCGAAGCHKKDVDDSRGTARCKLCHSGKVVEESIFD